MKKETVNRLEHFALTVVFFVLAYLLSTRIPPIPSVVFWIAVGPATLRLAHTISFNEIAEWLRHPFCEVVDDTAGGSLSIQAKDGPFKVVGELMSCPICSGTWSALFLYTVYALLPQFGLVLVVVFGSAGISEILHCLTDLLEWSGRAHREQAGTSWLLKNKGGYIGAFAPKEFQDKKRGEVLYEWKIDTH